MGELPDATGAVDFKIIPKFIPSGNFTRLDPYAHSSGGIGDIWRCMMSTEMGSFKTAVKCIRTNLQNEKDIEKTRGRIRREAYVWITLKHDHVLSLEGITDGFGKLPALVCLWMENGPLSNYLKEKFHTLLDHHKIELVHQVASGLGYLHGEDVVHGDLTGTNVLVDESGNIRLADFGLSLIAAEAGNFTFGSVQSGNTRWTPPEFLNYLFNSESQSELKPTKEGDIYSFGCVMLQIFSGEEPFAHIRSAGQIFNAIFQGREPFKDVTMKMNDGCAQLSKKCLLKQPEGRPTIVTIVTDVKSIKGEVN